MQKDIRLHGQAGDTVEYFVTVVGNDSYQRYFFNVAQDDDQLRIFCPGSEFVISPEGVSYQGNGGFFCEYMFGVNLPSSDLAKPDIINRLVMYGARPDDSGGIRFSSRTSGQETYDTIFSEGNAVCNYFFFVHFGHSPSRLNIQQEQLVKRIGKAIKRSVAVGSGQDDELIAELFPLLGDDAAQLFVVKLVHRGHREYRTLFNRLYLKNKKIPDDDFSGLVDLAAALRIDHYQQERMRIDVMYRHPANKRIVDEYRAILLGCTAKGEISQLDSARLNRLKTLSVRSKIPGALFYTLDEMLKKGHRLKKSEEVDYLASTREVLEGIFLREKEIESHIDREDTLKLIKAKKSAMENRDHSFDQLMLDAGKVCDEKIRDGADPSLLDGFSYVVTYLDRFDNVANQISQLAFMENVRITRILLRELLEHKAAFDNLQEGCFYELFIRELLGNSYLGRFGRRKAIALMDGLTGIEARRLTFEELYRQLMEIDQEERIFIVLLGHVRDRIRNFYSRFNSRDDEQALRHEVTEELKARKLVQDGIPDQLFSEIVVIVKTEAMYLHTLLPTIVAERDIGLREDFLENAGLDRFHVEELEREYYENMGLDLEDLYQIRKGLS